jgi:hypothetical protein
MPVSHAAGHVVPGGLDPRDGTVALKLRLARVLDSISLEPDGMPHSAILLVRRLGDPLSGQLSSTDDRARTRAWGRAMQSMLAHWYRRAERPADGPVPSNANAVRFADRAELLAVLARDLVAGHARARWWWTPILRTLSRASVDALVSAWASEPVYLPAVLEHLTAWRSVNDVLGALSPELASSLLTLVADAHGAPGLAPNRISGPGPGSEGRSAAGIEHQTAAYSPPWATVLPVGSVPSWLGPERCALLGIGLVLHRFPLVARSAGFGREFRIWWRSAPSAVAGPTIATASRAAVPAEPEGVCNPQAPTGDAGKDPTRSLLPETPPTRSFAGAPLAVPQPSVVSGLAVHPRPHHVARPESVASPARPTGSPSSIEGVLTELGGILFLVNLLHAFRLPQQIEQHFEIGARLSGWAWIELLGRCLLGSAASDVSHDPLWSVLALLDGRSVGTPAGTGFAGRPPYLLPEDWTAMAGNAGENPFSWCLHAGTIEVWHPRNFIVMARAIGDASLRDVRNEVTAEFAARGVSLRRLSPVARRRFADLRAARPLALQLDRPLRRFLEFLLPFIRWRLAGALQLEQYDAEGLVQGALRRRGRLYVTAAHVDLVLELAQVTLPVRMAGLDFDPGWVPELARVITFRFV